ncbi:MAG: hypothetical protein OWV35_12760 [Firmicutes bacterium]|nr:hypothetical protein [Bacillota bacterium]
MPLHTRRRLKAPLLAGRVRTLRLYREVLGLDAAAAVHLERLHRSRQDETCGRVMAFLHARGLAVNVGGDVWNRWVEAYGHDMAIVWLERDDGSLYPPHAVPEQEWLDGCWGSC